MKYLGPYDRFPPPETATAEGLVAYGADLDPDRVITAYREGIFPWYEEGQPILWWSPDPRMVLFPNKLKISKSMRQILKKELFNVTFNQRFWEVMKNCANARRKGQKGTWITAEIQKAYLELHQRGEAISVEVWQGERLVGGLYGVHLRDKKIFCGESMFSRMSNASKYGFIKLVEELKTMDIRLIDCQVYTEHLESLGAEEISRSHFLQYLRQSQLQ